MDFLEPETHEPARRLAEKRGTIFRAKASIHRHQAAATRGLTRRTSLRHGCNSVVNFELLDHPV